MRSQRPSDGARVGVNLDPLAGKTFVVSRPGGREKGEEGEGRGVARASAGSGLGCFFFQVLDDFNFSQVERSLEVVVFRSFCSLC